LQFSSVGIISRRDNRDILDTLHALINALSAYPMLSIRVDSSVAELLNNSSMPVVDRTQMGHCCQLVIVVGGDGSMLKAAATLAEQGVPVVGVNRGRLGFLTDILPDDIELSLAKIMQGKYRLEPRFLLDVELCSDSVTKRMLGKAMNDIVLHPGVAAQMIEFDLYVDDQFVYHQSSDGLIVATPTGSTAYAMSAGGPIMHPRLDALVLIPMYPHSLSSRPIVVNSHSVIKIIIGKRHGVVPHLSCDGTMVHTCESGQVLEIRRKTAELQLLHPEDYDYYATCRSKLGWSRRPGQQKDK
jgi:NAD+ kinase